MASVKVCDGPELARKTVAHIRATWCALPNLGDDDSTRLTRYVITEEGLQSALAWLAAGALPPAALTVPRKTTVSYHMTCSVQYFVQLSDMLSIEAAWFDVIYVKSTSIHSLRGLKEEFDCRQLRVNAGKIPNDLPLINK